MKNLRFYVVGTLIVLVWAVGIVQATPPLPMGLLTNNNTCLNIPTYDGKNQVTHPCVLYTESGWNGFTYLMTMTPYPYYDSSKENPSMRYSNDGITWEKITGQPDPVINNPSVGFYSDPNIELVGGTVYLFYRYAYTAPDPDVIYYNYTTTTDGVTWTTPVQTDMNLTRSNSFVFNGTGWESWGHSTATGNLTHYTSADAITWTQTGTTSINTTPFSQWHSEVKKYDNQYMVLMSDSQNKNLRFYTSSDGLLWNLENNNSPVMSGRAGRWDEGIYKTSFVEMNNSYKVWYAAFSAKGSSKVGYTQYPGSDSDGTSDNRLLSLSRYFCASNKFAIPFSIHVKKNLSESFFSQ